jgi:hypothetical protein
MSKQIPLKQQQNMTIDLTTIAVLRIHFDREALQNRFADTIPASVIVENALSIRTDANRLIRHEITQILNDEGESNDPNHANVLIQKCAIAARWKANRYRIRTQKQLQTALEDVHRLGGTELTIMVDTTALSFSPHFTGRELDLISASSTTGFAQLGTGAGTTPSNTSGATNSADVFDLDKCDRGVKDRVESFLDATSYLPVKDMTAFPDYRQGKSHPRLYYINPHFLKERVIIRNGSILESTFDAKRFRTGAPSLPARADAANLRRWYHELSRHALASGLYIHPYELFAPGTGGSTGFAYDIDLPHDCRAKHAEWSDALRSVLRGNYLFGNDNNKMAVIARGPSCGYEGLFALLTMEHPAFVEDPTALTRDLPRQEETETIFGYHARFQDVLYLRTVFGDTTTPDLQDAFISGCRHAAYLRGRARLDRQDPSKAARFSIGQIHLTVAQYLAAADAPSDTPTDTPINSPYPGVQPPVLPAPTAIIHQIDFSDISDSDLDYYSQALIHQTKVDGTVSQCIICNGNHRENCPALRDTRFMARHVVQLAQFASKMKRAAQDVANGRTPPDRDKPRPRFDKSKGARPATSKHKIRQMMEEPELEENDAGDSIAPDFQQGPNV